MMVYVEILIVLIILAYSWAGFRRGFLAQIFDLVGIVVSFFIALKFYYIAANIFENWQVIENLSKPVGFFALWFLGQIIFYFIILLVMHFIPQCLKFSQVNRWLGIIPGLVKGVVIIAIILMLLFILPLSPAMKDNLIKYPISGYFIKSTARVEAQMERVFSDMKSLALFTTVTENEEMTKLNFKIDKYTIDEGSENAMVNLVNEDRDRAGLSALQIDYSIREVARLHSIDMAQKGYFSHVNLDGKTPADRMVEDGVSFWLAGENIALAPTYELAEIGFLNSPKHRDNILDPKYSRIGIGIIDTGVYGRMVTQNFAD